MINKEIAHLHCTKRSEVHVSQKLFAPVPATYSGKVQAMTSK